MFTELLKLLSTSPGKQVFLLCGREYDVLLPSGICSQCKCTRARLQIKCGSGRVWVWQQPRKLRSLSASSLGIVWCVGLKSAWYQHTVRQSWWGASGGLFSCTVVHTGCWGKLISECYDSDLAVFACSSCSTWDSRFFPSPLLISWVVVSSAAWGDAGGYSITRDDMWNVQWKSRMFVITPVLTLVFEISHDLLCPGWIPPG